MIISRVAFSSRSHLRKLDASCCCRLFVDPSPHFFLQPFPHLKALIVLLPGNGIAESSVAHSYFTTPDAGSAEFDAGAGSSTSSGAR